METPTRTSAGTAMPMSTDVNLPKSQIPVFPDRCVACGQTQPGDSIRVCTHAIGWWTGALWAFGSRFCVDVPACYSCRIEMRRQKWSRRIITWGFAAIGVAVAVYLLAEYHGPFKRWLTLGIALLCLLPLIVWETLFPPPLDLTAYSNTVDYEFRDAEYATEFAALNNGKIDEEDS